MFKKLAILAGATVLAVVTLTPAEATKQGCTGRHHRVMEHSDEIITRAKYKQVSLGMDMRDVNELFGGWGIKGSVGLFEGEQNENSRHWKAGDGDDRVVVRFNPDTRKVNWYGWLYGAIDLKK